MLAHSDVAPARKQDPGRGPWRLLAGIGLWVKPAPLDLPGPDRRSGRDHPTIEDAQKLLAKYGYGVSPSGYFDSTTRDAIAAFHAASVRRRSTASRRLDAGDSRRDLIAERDAKRELAKAAERQEQQAKPGLDPAADHLADLDARARSPHPSRCQSAGRLLGPMPKGGSGRKVPGSIGCRCRITSSRARA